MIIVTPTVPVKTISTTTGKTLSTIALNKRANVPGEIIITRSEAMIKLRPANSFLVHFLFSGISLYTGPGVSITSFPGIYAGKRKTVFRHLADHLL
jgi:hypothetical protein